MAANGIREIAGYRIQSEIGRGGMGVVYLAEQSSPNRKVALKVLTPDLANDPGFRERFQRESEAAASTEHPHIVPIYAAGESDGQLYLAMRYVEGTDLRSLLERGELLEPERAARICAEIAEALEAAHERGLIHRDVKPGNVLLDSREHAYLTDFGLIRRTRIESEITRTGQFIGTIDYVAPEQIKGSRLDGRADIYSLGCVLFECLTGTAPFRRDSEVATVYAHLEETPPRPSARAPSVPPSLDTVVARAMAKRPEDRFATAGGMADALRAKPVVPARRLRRRATLVYAAIGLALVTGAAFALTRDGVERPAGPMGSTVARAPRPGTLVAIDPETGEVREGFPTTGRRNPDADPPEIEVGAGSIWMGGGDDPMTAVDLDTGEESPALSFGPARTGPIRVADRLVWAAVPPGIRAIDPATLETVKGIKVIEQAATGGAAPLPPAASDLGAGAGAIWGLFPDGTLAKIPTRSIRVTERTHLPGADDVEVSDRAVLVTDKLGGVVRVLDPRSLRVVDEIEVTGTIDRIATGPEGVWILDPVNGSVTEIDVAEERAGHSWDVGGGARDLDVGLGWIWVARSDGTLLRVNPATGESLAIDIGTPLVAVSAGAEPGAPVWVLTWALVA
jgi:predicted Ser/Thr protein kinase/outer membrane protein assembly factor BamB